jgi:hypothetical protein
MPDHPLAGTGEELATALHAGDPDHREPSIAISSAYVFEAQKLESLRPSTGLRASLGGKSECPAAGVTGIRRRSTRLLAVG